MPSDTASGSRTDTQSGQSTANGQGASSGDMSNDQVLSEAMEVFNRSVQSGSMPGSTPAGDQGEAGPLDRTASTTGGTGSQGQATDSQTDGAGQQAGSGNTGSMPAGGTMEGMETAGSGGTSGSAGGADSTGQTGNMGTTGGGTMGPGSQVYGSSGSGQQAGTRGSQQDGNQAGGGTGSAGQDASTGVSGRRVIVIGGGTGVMTEEERIGNYDRELEEQMQVFDGIILGRRQETIARSNEEGAGDVPGSGAGGYGSESGYESAPLLTTASVDPNNNRTAGQLPDAPSDNRQGDYQNQSDPNSNVPPDISDGSDDDIVARQLREAAMAEQDPVLREKLWDEYRKYKEGVQARR